MNRAPLVACVIAVISTGCATRGAVRQVAEDLKAVQAELAALRQAQDDLSRRINDVSTMARATQARTDPLQAAVTASTAGVERLSEKVQATDEAVREVKETLAARAAAPAPPPPPPTPVLAAPEPAKPKAGGSAEASFAAGLTNFRNREYGQAVLDFLDIVTKHPTHELAPTAQFWIGEAYYLQHDYRQALVEFQRAVDWAPPNPKIADALLKAGLCYSQLRESSRAQGAWRRVVREFPDSPAAEEARNLLGARGSASPPSRR
jgi:tol-pal system protein YbgF